MNGADIMDVLQMCSRPPPALMPGEKFGKIESEIDLHWQLPLSRYIWQGVLLF